MKNSAKRTDTKNRKISIIIITILLILGLYLAISAFMQKQENSKLADDITATHTELADITQQLSSESGLKWRDASECYRLKPRLFGDKYTNVCDVIYSVNSQKISQAKLIKIINGTVIKGESVSFGNGVKINNTQSYSAGFMPGEKLHESRPCVLTYNYLKTALELSAEMSCYYKVDEGTYKYLGQQDILPNGEDRF